MSDVLRIRRGTDIKLQGEAEKILTDAPQAETYAIKPTDFVGIKPKVVVKEGHEVKAGTVLMYDKNKEEVKFTSPVSGEVVEVKRGDKRKLLEIVILADKEIKYEDFGSADPNALGREEIIKKLCASGLWPFIKQRPYDVIANPADKPKSIFITAYDSAPLAPDNDFIFHGQGALFQKGLDALTKLTEGKVHLTVDGSAGVDEAFTNAKNVVLHKVSGPHPAGNVGVHIHHFDPIGAGQTVWTLNAQDVLSIGRLFESGKFDASRIITICGSQINDPKYYKTIMGTSTKKLFQDLAKHDQENRYISGNVLTGEQIAEDGYLGYYDYQLTAIPEGGEPRMFGWITPNPQKFSVHRSLVSWLQPAKKYALNAEMNGEERPFVVTEEYEKVFPFDIYPVQLIKAIMVEDIELMEALGIYEVAPEDFALCEVVCTSKIPSQTIVRDGLEMLRKEMS
jgi:Na+-transporting NADH:ubiquinone oxidoreductase subunit A